MENNTAEHQRLREKHSGPVAPWRKWGPYVSERSWGSVREDYSPDGCAWEFLTHDMARSKAYRWGEDGIAGICDRYQLLVFALALWNGRDPILKERMFGLTGNEGNHGEDAKEYWFYLDNTPTHSYMKVLYKYPQVEFPYQKLLDENRRRWGQVGAPEYELLDTGIFDENRYFDVFVEYAKAGPEDICVRIEAINRGREAADLHLMPHLWFRNTWAWTDPAGAEPSIRLQAGRNQIVLVADESNATSLHNLQFPYSLETQYLYAPEGGEALFTDNENNAVRLYGCSGNRKPYVKDAFHRHIINHEDCVNPRLIGTKSCIHYKQRVPPGGSMTLRLRLTPEKLAVPLNDVDEIVRQRKTEADEFYASVHPPAATAEEKAIQRQALAGMLWSKQIYLWDVNRWLEGDNPKFPPPESRKQMRNIHWRHLNSMRILSMPDKWEFPWFAAWDLAFQCITLALVDPEFAKENLWVLLFEQFQHPNGQIPAYEWEFSDLNPPVHAWACWRVYQSEKQRTGKGDTVFLEKCLHKLLMNFAWWVNRVDSEGNNVFEGGFLGLDNIAVVDRGEKFPNGAILEQSDATGWMGFFCLYLMRIALELANQNRVYEGVATKFFEHFIYIGAAMKKMGGRNYQLWDEQEGFFYDVLRYPNGEFHKFRLRSLVGLIPLYAIEVLESEELIAHPGFLRDVEWFIQNRPDLVGDACYTVGDGKKRYVLSIADPNQFKRLMQRIWDPEEFLSSYGIRSLSKYHEQHPFQFGDRSMGYEPGEAAVKLKGGNSNWRGPVWFPTSYLLIHSFLRFGDAVGPQFSLPTAGSKNQPVTPHDIAREAANRMIGIFKRGADGKRPCFGFYRKFQDDPHWNQCLLFNEYYNGDSGMGLGASHQTGWSGLVANLIDEWRR
ncbi:MAG: glucosidase [Acidobacteriia bacterium]|nr:glucosidase [Terriglobia bacterium]